MEKLKDLVHMFKIMEMSILVNGLIIKGKDMDN